MSARKPLTPGRLGEVLAHIAHFSREHTGQIVDRLGLDPDHYAEDARRMKAALGEDLSSESLEGVTNLVRAYHRVKKSLEARRPKLESIRPDVALEPTYEKPAFMPPKTRPKPEAQAPVEPVRAAPNVPSYLQARSALSPEIAHAAQPMLAFHAQPPVAAPPAQPGPPRRSASTNKMELHAAASGTPMPFKPSDNPVAPPATAAAAPKGIGTGTAMADGPMGESPPTPFRPSGGGFGIGVPSPSPAASRANATPSASTDPAAKSPGLTLGRFVELTVALASGEDKLQTLGRFGLTSDTHRAIAADWGARIGGDASLRQQFDELVKARRGGSGG